MKTIVVGSTKGGTGKTTIATNLAVSLSKRGNASVLIIDADPQGSAMSWRALRKKDDAISAVAITTPTLHKEIPKVGAHFDFVIVDVGGRDSTLLRSAFLAADIIIVPVLASPYDVWASCTTAEIINETENVKGDEIPHYLLLNQVIPRTIILRDALVALDIDELPSSISTRIQLRTIYKTAAAKGLSVFEMTKKNRPEKAISEIEDLTQNIIEMLGLVEFDEKYRK